VRAVENEFMKQFLFILTVLLAALVLLRAGESFSSPQSNHLGVALSHAAKYCVYYKIGNGAHNGSNESWMTQLKKSYLDCKQIDGNSRYEIQSAVEEARKSTVPDSHPFQLRSIPATPQ
jgi:hypothetical protein